MKILLTTPLFLLPLAGCHKPDQIQIYPSASPELSYRVETFNCPGAACPSSMAVYAVFQDKQGHDEALVLSGTYMDLKSIKWEGPKEGAICLAGGYTQTYRRIAVLGKDNNTQAIYTHLNDRC